MKTENGTTCLLMLSLLAVLLIFGNMVMASLTPIQASTDIQSTLHSTPQLTPQLTLHPKPSSPINIRIQPLTTPVAGRLIEFEVVATSKIRVDDLAINVELPIACKLQAGSLNWRGQLVQGQEKAIRFSVMFPDNGQCALVARATMGDSLSGQFSAIHSYSFGSSNAPAQLKAVSAQSVRFATRDGRRLIQYKIQ